MKTIFYFTTVLFLTHISVHAQDQKDSTAVKKDKQIIKKTMKFKIPSSLQEEHKELHHTLEKFTQLPGKTGIAAKEVAKLLHPHFIKEEEYALPPLGLLVDLSKGKISDEMKPAIVLSDKLKQDLQQMLSEHQQIVASLEKLKKAAKEENYPDVLRFTETLKLHAQTEEQVLYPTAILIGEYLKLKL